MSTTNDGGSAFPVLDKTVKSTFGGVDAYIVQHKSEGMSLRAYFAGQAMQGMLADPECGGPASTALAAVSYADALIAELEKS